MPKQSKKHARPAAGKGKGAAKSATKATAPAKARRPAAVRAKAAPAKPSEPAKAPPAADVDVSQPLPYPAWPTDRFRREETAANTMGYFLMRHCRDEALARIPNDASDATRAAVTDAVDTALHNVMDLVEGFWPLSSGPSHRVEVLLQVRVTDNDHRAIETVPLEGLDLPIGYWKWAREDDFR